MADGVQLSGAGVQLVPATGGGGGSATPGGPINSVQFNANGVLGGSNDFVFNMSTGIAQFTNPPQINSVPVLDQGALDAALVPYLTTANAATTYLTITNAADEYMTQDDCDTRYLQLTGGALQGPLQVPSPLGVNGTSGSNRQTVFETGGSARMGIGIDAVPETGADAGSNFTVWSYHDDGSQNVFPPLTINRKSGQAILSARPAWTTMVNGVPTQVQPYDPGNLPGGFLPITGGTINGNLTVTGTESVGGTFTVTAAAGVQKIVSFASAGSPRWSIGSNAALETGNNVGSDFRFQRFSDTGAVIDQPMAIIRSTGVVEFNGAPVVFAARPTFMGNTPWDNGNLPNALSFITQAQADARYLQLAGGAVTGNATFSSNVTVGNNVNVGATLTAFQLGATAATLTGTINGTPTLNVTGQSSLGATEVFGTFKVDQTSSFTGQASFAVRPVFGTATPWDSVNLVNPINQTTGDARYLQLTGGRLTGPLNNGNAGTSAVAAAQFISLPSSTGAVAGQLAVYPSVGRTFFNLQAQQGDAVIVSGPVVDSLQGLTIGLWSTLAGGTGLRIGQTGVTFPQSPTVPTPATTDSSTLVATTAFVKNAISSASGSRYDIIQTFTGDPAAAGNKVDGNFRMMQHVFSRAVTFPNGFAGARFFAYAADGNNAYTFGILATNKSGSIGSISWAATATAGVLTSTSTGLSFNPGDVLEIFLTSTLPSNPSLGGFYFNIPGALT